MNASARSKKNKKISKSSAFVPKANPDGAFYNSLLFFLFTPSLARH